MADIQTIHSIAGLTPEDCLQTQGSYPVRVFCSDYNYYICKYFKGEGPAYSLFNEYIASCFLKVSGIKSPEIAFVNIKKEHILDIGYPYHIFERSCFGSRYHNEYQEVDGFLTGLRFANNTVDLLRESFLRIALFDIWLGNEDRHGNNYNMLFDYYNYKFIPIDHVQIFNGNNLDKEPEQITEEESILTSPLFRKIFYRTLQSNLSPIRLNVIDSYRKSITDCHAQLNHILSGLPDDWRLDAKYLQSRLAFLFTEDWINQSINSFDRYFQISLNHR
jgi:hypothetical protein